MEASNRFYDLPDRNTVTPCILATIVAILFVSMFSVFISTFLLIYKVVMDMDVINYGLTLMKPKKATIKITSDKPVTSEDEQPSANTAKDSDTVVPDDLMSLFQKQVKERENLLYRLIRLQFNANKMYYAIIICLMMLLMLHLTLVFYSEFLSSPAVTASSENESILAFTGASPISTKGDKPTINVK